MPIHVVIQKMMPGRESLVSQLEESFHSLGIQEDFARAKAVFIKPNLTYPSYRPGVTTRLEFVESLIAALRGINTSTLIYVGEAEAGYNSFSMTDGMRAMGFYRLPSEYPGVQVVNLSAQPRRRVELKARGRSYAIELPALFFDEIDFSITCPVPKIHCMTRLSLSFKNQWGCLPDALRLKNHYVFDEIIGQVCTLLKFRYAFLDGKFGLDKNGPLAGEAIETDWFVAANSLGAFDVTVAQMMGMDWREVGHLRMAEHHGLIPKQEEIHIEGDTTLLRRKFSLHRNFWNYPALAAFHSRGLTHFFYFSKWAKLLHDIMYFFRKRPIA